MKFSIKQLNEVWIYFIYRPVLQNAVDNENLEIIQALLDCQKLNANAKFVWKKYFFMIFLNLINLLDSLLHFE